MSNTLHAEIAEQAYYLWLKDGRTHGRAAAHWAAAEAMIAGRKAVATVTQARKPATKAPKVVRAATSKRAKAPVVLHA